MAREREGFRETIADIYEVTGKRTLGVYDVMAYLTIGYIKALKFMDGQKTITAHQLAKKII
jgi:hypothetical protein